MKKNNLLFKFKANKINTLIESFEVCKKLDGIEATTLDWLSLLPEPYRTPALTNNKHKRGYLEPYQISLLEKNEKRRNIVGAIDSFEWRASPQGHNFWAELQQTYLNEVGYGNFDGPADFDDDIIDDEEEE